MTPDRIKAFLDDLALLCEKHRIMLAHGRPIEMHPDFGGCVYYEDDGVIGSFATSSFRHADINGHISSIDITQLSAHERFAILGNRSPDLAGMLRDAFLAGSEGDEDWCKETRPAFEREADEYAAKIMGGQSNG